MKEFSREELRHIESLKSYLGDEFLKEFEDSKTIEIILNPDGKLWVEKLGENIRHFGEMNQYNSRAAMNVVATFLGFELTKDNPVLEGEFPLDGSRFAGLIPPATAAPTFAIRKKASSIFTLEQYEEAGIMTKNQMDIIYSKIKEHKNILVAGGTSSGKTTLVNAIIKGIVDTCPNDRIIIMEDTGEIQCSAVNSTILHTTLNISLSDLLKVTLRLRPDRIIVGEVRDYAAFDLLKAWNTGHPGGTGTIHSDTALSAIERVEMLVSEHPHSPDSKDIKKVIAQSVHLIVNIAKTNEGRRVREIIEITGYDNDQYKINQIG